MIFPASEKIWMRRIDRDNERMEQGGAKLIEFWWFFPRTPESMNSEDRDSVRGRPKKLANI